MSAAPDGFALVNGVLVAQDKKRIVCKFCGAVYQDRGGEDGEIGVKNHERECRAQTRNRWTGDALRNPVLAEKGPQAVREFVDAQIALYDALPRESWVEHRGQ